MDYMLAMPNRPLDRPRLYRARPLPVRAALPVLLVASLVAATVEAQPAADAAAAGFDQVRLDRIGPLVEQAIADRLTPGAVVVVGRGDRVVFEHAYGQRAVVPSPEPMTVDTVFDMASLTKVMATGTSIMQLLEAGTL